MPGRECYHCKQWVEEGEAHDCWTTTEAALTKDLSEDLRDAWERLRDTAAGLDRKSTRLNSSHGYISYAVFCLKKKKKKNKELKKQKIKARTRRIRSKA